MLIGFIGAPCSGKTTTAARLFAELKDNGIPAEFISEEARRYIAEKRCRDKEDGLPFSLDDLDQGRIATNQFFSEKYMVESAPQVVVVADSSVLNSALYMSDEFAARKGPATMMEIAAKRYDIIFLCAPVQLPAGSDPNRVHDAKQIAEIQQKISELLVKYGLSGNPKVIPLGGPTNVRLQAALSAVYNQMAQDANK